MSRSNCVVTRIVIRPPTGCTDPIIIDPYAYSSQQPASVPSSPLSPSSPETISPAPGMSRSCSGASIPIFYENSQGVMGLGLKLGGGVMDESGEEVFAKGGDEGGTEPSVWQHSSPTSNTATRSVSQDDLAFATTPHSFPPSPIPHYKSIPLFKKSDLSDFSSITHPQPSSSTTRSAPRTSSRPKTTPNPLSHSASIFPTIPIRKSSRRTHHITLKRNSASPHHHNDTIDDFSTKAPLNDDKANPFASPCTPLSFCKSYDTLSSYSSKAIEIISVPPPPPSSSSVKRTSRGGLLYRQLIDSDSTTSSFRQPPPETVQLAIDQEGYRAITFELTFLRDDGGILEFAAKGDAYPFHSGPLQKSPSLRRIHTNNDFEHDYLSRQATLAIGQKNGIYKVSSSSKDGSHRYSFVYEVVERLSINSRVLRGERMMRPLLFLCSREFLAPSRRHKVTVFKLLKKALSTYSSSQLIRMGRGDTESSAASVATTLTPLRPERSDEVYL